MLLLLAKNVPLSSKIDQYRIMEIRDSLDKILVRFQAIRCLRKNLNEIVILNGFSDIHHKYRIIAVS